jgi:putative ubiquitin-RnfH superfamily antitoxin RatB of RatAB toxin-antitoxin module
MALTVEVVFAVADGFDSSRLELPPGATLGEAIERSGILARHPEIDLAGQKVGVFGKACALGQPAADGDRIEIYRCLAMDPKEARRRRAAARPGKRTRV